MTQPQPPARKTLRLANALYLLLGIILFLKPDQVIGGYLNFPAVRMLTMATPLGLIVAIALLFKNREGKPLFFKWLPFLMLLYFQPFFPTACKQYATGVYYRIQSAGGMPEVIQWAQQYQFSSEILQADENQARNVMVDPCPELKRIGGSWIRTEINPKTRDVHVIAPGHFIGYWGLTIGKGAWAKRDESRLSFCATFFQISDDAYVWSDPVD